MQVTIHYGLSEETVPLRPGTKFSDLKSDLNLRAIFGWGDNLRFLMDGVEMPMDGMVPMQAHVWAETAANTKAIPCLA